MRALVLLALLLAACGPRTEPYKTAERPEAPKFLSAVPAGHTAYDNSDLADIFVKLTHYYEDGDQSAKLSRFKGPVTVSMIGDGADRYQGFLSLLLGQINRETGIDIKPISGPANILVRFVPGEQFLRLTNNQCVIIFGQPSWSFFLSNAGDFVGADEDPTAYAEKIGVFIPDTIEPYKVRQCIVEEIVQALGTSNDLYGLAPTMFNDDQAHYWPTKLDYLMLRVLYDPEMIPGNRPIETRKRALGILNRLNPAGVDAPRLPPVRLQEFAGWRENVHKLTDKNAPPDDPLALAESVALEATRLAPGSNFECEGKMVLALITDNEDEGRAQPRFDEAMETCTKIHGPENIRVSFIKLRQAWRDYNNGRYQQARSAARAVGPVFIAYGQDDYVAEAKILDAFSGYHLGDPNWDGKPLSDAAAWSAYAYGDDHTLTDQLRR